MSVRTCTSGVPAYDGALRQGRCLRCGGPPFHSASRTYDDGLDDIIADCPHDDVYDIQRDGGIISGRCRECGLVVTATGDEDDLGIPGWEVLA